MKKLKVIYVGRLSEFKGFHNLIKVMNDLSNEKIEFVKIGKGKLEKNIPNNKNIKYIGAVDYEKIFEYYKDANVLILPSYSETFSYVILEAMACGLVVLTSDLATLRVLVTPKRNGYLFRPGDTEKIKEFILYLKNNLEEVSRISKNNLIDANRFINDKIIPKYETLYKSLLI